MTTLYTYGPMLDLIDASPFVIKTHLLLRMAKIEYSTDRGGYNKAPKGKLPFINDNGQIISDSTFIRMHIEKTRRIDFDAQKKSAEWMRQSTLSPCAPSAKLSKHRLVTLPAVSKTSHLMQRELK